MADRSAVEARTDKPAQTEELDGFEQPRISYTDGFATDYSACRKRYLLVRFAERRG
jgi:hypothetical protein